MNRHRIASLILTGLATMFLLAAAPERCTIYLPFISRQPATSATPTPTSTATPMATHTSTPTSTLTPTPTRTPIPSYTLSGRVFFDYNGSGLQEEGEPGIQGVPVYVDSLGSALHATTGADGSYSIPNVPSGAHQVYVQSPTQDPATAFRYINLFKGWVDIPAYEMNGVQVPAQHLPDTEIQPVNQPLSLLVGGNQTLNVALMQGFLTLPFVEKQVKPQPFIIGYFDILGNRVFDDSFQYWDSLDGVMLSFDGKYSQPGDLYTLSPGVDDSHTGYDYIINRGDLIVSGAPTSIAFYITQPPEEELRLHTWLDDPASSNHKYSSTYGHLDVSLVQVHSRICRGQIIGLGGSSGMHPPVPLLHYDIAWYMPPESSSGGGWWYLDPYRYTVHLDPLPANFWGSEVSYWTKDNDPQFPLVALGDQRAGTARLRSRLHGFPQQVWSKAQNHAILDLHRRSRALATGWMMEDRNGEEGILRGHRAGRRWVLRRGGSAAARMLCAGPDPG